MKSAAAAPGIPQISPKTIIKQGWLYKQSRFLKQWRKRWFVLTEHHLVSFKEYKVYSKPTQVVQVKGCKTVKSVDDQIHKLYSFKLDTGKRVFLLQAQDSHDKQAWIGALGKTMVRPTVMLQYPQQNYGY